MSDIVEAVHCGRLQAAVDEQRIVMTNEREAYDPNGLEHARPDEGEALRRIAFQLGCDVRTFDKDRGDDDQHPYERKTRCA